MLMCGECHRWYHFRCVDLAERDGEELAFYICPSCNVTTGKVSRENWELDDNELADVHIDGDALAPEPPFSHSSDEDEGSEDNFVEENEPVAAVQDPTSDHSDEEATIGTRIHRRGTRKRKSISKQIEAPAKRHRSDEPPKSSSPGPGSSDDPVRKSCLKLLVALLTPIFAERLPDELDPPAEGGNPEQYATELEACVFEIYAEPGEYDGKVPGNKYKDRVRMLNFNLSKKDRRELRKSIRVGLLSPDTLSRMSSLDLANAQAQQEAQKLAEESMKHSILQAQTAPLRKITHKGEQMIEKTVEEDSWRMQEEDSAREQERERQRTRINSIDGDRPPPTPLSASFRRSSFDLTPLTSTPQSIIPTDRSFDPASTVFNIDFDGDGSNMLNHGPLTPPELSGDPMEASDNVLGDDVVSSPPPTSSSPMAPNFSLDGLFGASDTVHPSWSEPQEDGSIGGHSTAGDDLIASSDADFDAFITVDEDEESVPAQPAQPQATASAPTPTPQVLERALSLADISPLWRGHVRMPSIADPNRMIQFQSQFKQIGGAEFHDTEENRKSLFPASLFEIIGRVSTSQAINYLVSMRLNPTKELFAVAIIPGEEDKAAYLELHKLLIAKDRYGLIFPWGQDPALSAPGKELYIAPLLPEHPVPEYLQLLDNVKIPPERDSPIFCGIFVLSKGRVTTLNPADPRPVVATPVPAVTIPAPASVNAPEIAPIVAPVLASSLSNLSESTLATLTKDLANLNPSQLELVRTLLLHQSASVAPSVPVPPPSGMNPHMPMHMLPHSAHGIPGPAMHANHSPMHNAGPAVWDRPQSYPEPGWRPGPAHYGRDDYRDERPPYNRGDSRGERSTPRGRGAGPSHYRGRGSRGGPRW
ncbi:hypothetical protein BDV93DRAFT_527877 [Ceratobasidium sp. AG-I]|nr:hypothetical protein BDV93DRAFT_527877 [Ceratobasidium sp. AG-I]